MNSQTTECEEQGTSQSGCGARLEAEARDFLPVTQLTPQSPKASRRQSTKWSANLQKGCGLGLSMCSPMLEPETNIGEKSLGLLESNGNKRPPVPEGPQVEEHRGTIIPQEWNGLLVPMRNLNGSSLLDFLISLGRTPATVREDDFALYVRNYTGAGGSYQSACKIVNSTRHLLLPHPRSADGRDTRAGMRRYGIPLRFFPEPLHTQVIAIRDYYAGARRELAAKAPVRPPTSKSLLYSFTSLYGYAVNVAGLEGIVSIEQLVTEEICQGLIEWGLNEGNLLGSSSGHPGSK